MMEFALLASGSKGNSFVIRDGTGLIMIDCGTTKKYLLSCLDKLGISRDELDAVLITHDHSDHIAQIRHFAGFEMYSPVDIADICHANVFSRIPFSVGSLTITPLALSHDARNTSGYIIGNGQEKLVYITDTGYVNESYLPLIAGADYYVMESNHDPAMVQCNEHYTRALKDRILGRRGHLSNQDCADAILALADKGVRYFILGHLSHENNRPELAMQTSVCRLELEGVEPGKDVFLDLAWRDRVGNRYRISADHAWQCVS